MIVFLSQGHKWDHGRGLPHHRYHGHTDWAAGGTDVSHEKLGGKEMSQLKKSKRNLIRKYIF